MKTFRRLINEYGEDSGAQDMHWGRYNGSSRKDGGNKDFIDKGKEDYYDGVPLNKCPYEAGYNKYYKIDLAEYWKEGWKEAKYEDINENFVPVPKHEKFKLYGKTFDCLVFYSEKETNKFLEDNLDYGVIGEEKSKIFVAKIKDKGE